MRFSRDIETLRDFATHPAWEVVEEYLEKVAQEYMRLAALSDTTHQYDKGLWQGYQRAIDDIRTWLSNTKRLGMKS